MSLVKKIKNIKFNKVSEKNGELIFIESKKIFKNGFKRFFSVSVKKKVTRVFTVILNVLKYYLVLMEI